MKVVGASGSTGRKVYAWAMEGLWFMSPLEKTTNGYRPIGIYSSEQEIVNIAKQRGLEVVWQAAN